MAAPNRVSALALATFARPLLFAFWVFVLWGTLYAAALGYATVVEGTSAWSRPLSGADAIGGVLSLIAAAVAVLVWGTIGLLLLVNRVQSRSRTTTGP